MPFRSISTKNAPAATIAVTPPAGIVDGDILVAFCVDDSSGTQTITWPSGFTDITGSPSVIPAPDGQQISVAIKKASGESGNYTITNTTANSTIIGGVAAFSGEDPTTFLHRTSVASNTSANASPQSITSAAFSGNTSGVCDVIVVAGADVTSSATVTWTPPTGFTTRAAISDNGGASFRQIALFSKDAAASGETGAYTATATDGVTAGWNVFAIALLSASGSPAITPSGFALAASLGTPVPGVTMLPGGQAITSALGTATAGSQSSVTVNPTGFAVSFSQGTFTTQNDITMTPTGGSLVMTLGTATTTGAGGNVNFVPTGFALSGGFGTPTVIGDVVVPISGLSFASSLGSPSVVFPALTALPVGFAMSALLNGPRVLGPVSGAVHDIHDRSRRSGVSSPANVDITS